MLSPCHLSSIPLVVGFVSGQGNVEIRRKSPLAAFVWASKANPGYRVMLLSMFGIGHCLVIALAGISTQAVQSYLNWNERSKGTTVLRRICGVLLIIGAVYLIKRTL